MELGPDYLVRVVAAFFLSLMAGVALIFAYRRFFMGKAFVRNDESHIQVLTAKSVSRRSSAVLLLVDGKKYLVVEHQQALSVTAIDDTDDQLPNENSDGE